MDFKKWLIEGNIADSCRIAADGFNHSFNLPEDWGHEFLARAYYETATNFKIDPDTILNFYPKVTFYYSPERGLTAGYGEMTHGEVAWKQDRIAIDRRSDLKSISGRYGAIEREIGGPVLSFWPANSEYFQDCLQVLKQEDLIHPDTLIYMPNFEGVFKDLVKTGSMTPKRPDPMVSIGTQSVPLSQIPAMLHTVPKESPIYQQIADFICKYKDKPEYSHVLGYIAHRVNCYNKKRNFMTYQQLRDMLKPDNIEKHFSRQKEIDAAFDKVSGADST